MSTVANTELKKNFKKPINPSSTRWCGYHKNLDSVLYLKPALLNVCVEYDNWADHTLSGSDWELIEAISSLLKFFIEKVQIFESESFPTMNEVTPRIYSLNERISGFIESSSNVQRTSKYSEQEVSKS